MNIYYIDYENVSSQGLKGVELLTENDEVVLLYSKKADNVKIDILTMMMASRAKIRFLPVHVGTPNALDFQLVTLLFLNYKEEDHCYIISKDSGYDCCIKTAAENGAPNVARYPNIESALNKAPVRKTRRGRRTSNETDSVQSAASSSEKAPEQSANGASSPVPDHSASAESAGSIRSDTIENAVLSEPEVTGEEGPSDIAPLSSSEEPARKKTSRRRGRKKSVSAEPENVQSASQAPSDAASQKSADPEKDKEREKESAPEKSPEQIKEKPQEYVLSQRYLSRQFEARNQQGSSGAKTDAEKPVSILSVIRRRNDVQLDMHQIDLIREALKNSGNKQQFYSYFVKKLGQKQGIELYHSVKSSYTDLVSANLL